MSLEDKLTNLQTRSKEIKSFLSKKEGSFESLKSREEEVTQKVSKAKGRLSLKFEVENFLEDLQSEIHQKAVGNYEKLLTAIANDVLDGNNIIGLNLYTERGLPALDIFLETENGEKEDIIEGAGGSMTNVMSLGLRMIATVKSGERKFVALDEPDCWISPKRVKNFYNIISELSKKLGLQSLVISHHSIDLLPEDFSIVELKSDENGAIQSINDPNTYFWKDDEIGIRKIKLKNFMSHKETEIKLNPGVTSIIGENNLGKSVFLRGLRAASYGECSDTDIKHGEKKLEVELEVENNKVIRFSRQSNRNPRNEWTLEDKNGNILFDKDHNTEFKTGGRNVPEWVQKILRINKVNGFDNQLSHQKFPVFLLGEGPSKRASVLSIGKESGYIRDMILKHKEKNKEDSIIIKEGEEEVYQIQEKLKKFKNLPDLKTVVDKFLQEVENSINNEKKKNNIHFLQNEILELSDKISKQNKIKDIISSYDHANIETIEETIEISHRLQKTGTHLSEVERKIESKKEALKALEMLPNEIPNLHDLKSMKKTELDIDKISKKIGESKKEEIKIKKDLEEAEKEINSILQEHNNLCPTCGQKVKSVEEFIEGQHES
jgi:DNA repair exonuclease SbcCD ATPase subunit